MWRGSNRREKSGNIKRGLDGRDPENWGRMDFRLMKYWGAGGRREWDGRVRFRVYSTSVAELGNLFWGVGQLWNRNRQEVGTGAVLVQGTSPCPL